VVLGFKHGEKDALQLMTAMVVENGLITQVLDNVPSNLSSENFAIKNPP
jgi:hypothetical protein